MQYKSVSACLWALLFIAQTHAFWRMGCPGRLSLERIDPIVSPGDVSGHVHTVSGGNGFGFTTSYEQQRASTCSSCPIIQDLSAYWTPQLYFVSEDGTFERVPQSGEGDSATGGMTVYYQQRPGKHPGSNTLENIEAFPPGLRMIAGDPFQRNFTNLPSAPGQAVSFVCLDYSGVSDNFYEMPNKNCPGGLRAQIYFPSCWDGMHNDTADHKSHMAYPIGHYDNGYCPPTHPHHLVSIFFEVIYQTNNFVLRWYNSSSHPFVFAQGDRTGYGMHGDFVNGWDTATLQKAIDTCTSDSGTLDDCSVFDTRYTDDECQSCRIPPSIDEAINGNLTRLPGCNPVTSGPEYAVPPTIDSPFCREGASPPRNNKIDAPPSPPLTRTSSFATTLPSSPLKPGSFLPTSYYTPLNLTSSLNSPAARWTYRGCTTDTPSLRTLSASSYTSSTLTVESCVNFCSSKGYSLAGVEYGVECYCDNTYHPTSSSSSDVTPSPPVIEGAGANALEIMSSSRKPKTGVLGLCMMRCGGDAEQICGGKGAMGIYGRCEEGEECRDWEYVAPVA